MEVVVDDKSGWATPKEGEKLGAVLEAVRTQIGNQKRAVATVSLDGEALTRAQQDSLNDATCDSYSLLEIRTIDPIELSLNTLTGLIGHLKNMDGVHREAAELVRGGEYDQAMQRLEGCFTGWEVVLRAVQDIARLTGAKLEELKAGEVTVQGAIDKLQGGLYRFRSAFDIKDVVTVGDVAEHELAPAVESWREVLRSLSEHVGRQSGTAAS